MAKKKQGSSRSRGKLVDRDYEILEHLKRYRLTTRDVLHRLFFSDSEINAVSKVTSRLVKHGYMASHDWDAAKVYFTVGPEACRLFGLAKTKCKPLGPQAFPTELGALMFCCGGLVQRKRLLVSEIAKSQPNLLGKGLDSSHYYIEELDGGVKLLGYIRVDQGGPPDHIARKCAGDLEKRRKNDALRELIDTDRFVIAIVTGHSSKADRIKENLARRQWTVRFRVEVSDALIGAIPRNDLDFLGDHN